MLRQVLLRSIQLVPVLVGIITILFFVLRLSGDPILSLLGPEGATSQQAVADLRRAYGLDEPLHVQYFLFMSRAITLDFGDSFVQRRPAVAVVLDRVPASIVLAATAMTVAVLAGLVLGTGAALSRARPVQFVATVVAVAGQSLPVFFVALVGLFVFSAQLKLLPAFGASGPESLILPTFALALLPTARIARLARASLVEVLSQEYVVTARSKGLAGSLVVWRHCLRNALIPIVTIVGYDLVQLFGSQAVAETVFAWPGVGSQLVISASQRDYPVVLVTASLVAVVAVVVTLVVDLTYRMLDPRVREAA
jgi:peptide/nickel transport system permease protein